MFTRYAYTLAGRWGLLLVAVAATAGCEVDSFLDPSTVGRWEQTPITVPILDRLDVIDEGSETELTVTEVRPEDLVPDASEYVMGPGDLVTVTVFELIVPGQESQQTRRIDETGQLRLQVIGPIDAAGKTPSELEEDIAEVLERKAILRDPTVSIIVQESRQNTFSVIGQPGVGGTAIGTYVIPKPDFRILDAVALAQGVPGRTRTLLVFRPVQLTDEAGTAGRRAAEDPADAEPAEAPGDSEELIRDLMRGIETEQDADGNDGESRPEQPSRPEPPQTLEGGLERGEGDANWVWAGDRWVRAGSGPADPPAEGQPGVGMTDEDTDQLGQLITQRIIEVPYERLLEGDMKYNIVIRPGDIIRVPDPTAGFVYAMGQIARPGAYTVPGERDLTLMQLIASAGGLGQLAIPERVDLVRRIDDNRQAMVRLDVGAIFDGTEPDIFLKPNDLINVGTNFLATPLAITRNGFRMTYGFGFILDRNFSEDVFGDDNDFN